MTEESIQLLVRTITSFDLTVRELSAEIKANTAATHEAMKATAQRPSVSGGYTPPKASPSKPFTASEEIPQPSEIIANAGTVEIHFGKNAGVPLANLGERSLSWYAAEQEPRLNSQGVPFPLRPQEITLRNAARTLWHQNKGTLTGSVPAPAATPPPPAANTNQGNVDEDVPF
jgi:hypothetical protein